MSYFHFLYFPILYNEISYCDQEKKVLPKNVNLVPINYGWKKIQEVTRDLRKPIQHT